MASQTPNETIEARWRAFVEECESGTHRSYTGAFEAAARRTGTSRFRLEEQFKRLGLCEQLPTLSYPIPEYVMKGTSTLVDAAGNVMKRWDKTRMRGHDDAEAMHLPDPKTITKISTLYDQERRVTQQWVAEKPSEAAKVEAWRQFALEMANRLPPVPAPLGPKCSDLMVGYPIGDHHIGMYAWWRETRANYDLDIAFELLDGAISYLVNMSPPCERALIAVLGDFTHYDGFAAITPTHGHLLDADSRFPKMIRTAARGMLRAIDCALRRHQYVHVIVEIGNHDPASAVWMMTLLEEMFRDNPRVSIDTSPRHYHFYQWGANAIGTHHGHEKKLEDLPLLMATDEPKMWGDTKYRTWWTGHRHKKAVLEFDGCTVESLPVLTAPDAYAANSGYRSEREMKAIVFHREYGEVSRYTVNPLMIEHKAHLQ